MDASGAGHRAAWPTVNEAKTTYPEPNASFTFTKLDGTTVTT